MRLLGAAGAVFCILTSGCASDNSAVPTSTETSPPYVGQVGVPVHARASNGATADITLNSVSWVPAPCAASWGCAVVEVTITNTSALTVPFKYTEDYVTSGFGGGPQPWTHPDDANRVGGSPNVDYVAIKKTPPLRNGAVTAGHTVHGFVGIALGGGMDLSGNTDLFIEITDPDNFENVEAGWHAHI